MIFLEQIGFVLRMCELFDSSKNIETTQSREKFIMAHLALRISLLVCVGKYSLSSCYLELENIYMFIFMCIDRYLKLTAGVRSCFSQNQGSLQARKEQEMALGLFSDLWARVGFYLENLLSFRFCKRMKRLFRHGGVFWGAWGRHSRGWEGWHREDEREAWDTEISTVAAYLGYRGGWNTQISSSGSEATLLSCSIHPT